MSGSPTDPFTSDRRTFLRRSAFAVGGSALWMSPFGALAASEPAVGPAGFGPIRPIDDLETGLPLLRLPRRFRYRSIGWIGQPMSDGFPTPPAHDGMGAFLIDGRYFLVRNHEVGGPIGVARIDGSTYDPAAGGGTTTLEIDPRSGRVRQSWTSLSGTVRNCAGGVTPWNSWLSCEESLDQPDTEPVTRPHGFVFEVPATGRSSGQPLVALGRFNHEAVAVDPETGVVYQTEDEGSAGFYRFLPNSSGRLERGGTLQMLAVAGQPAADLRTGQEIGRALPVRWVTIDEPNPPDANAFGVFHQGLAGGGAIFARLEGVWPGQGFIYFTSTNGGDAKLGQVWRFDPRRQELCLVFESNDPDLLDSPDNITVSPRGGVLLCEDSGAPTNVQGLTPDGRLFPFAENNLRLGDLATEVLVDIIEAELGLRLPFVSRALVDLVFDLIGNPDVDFRDGEFAGATFSPDGRLLFFNIQSPGVTFVVAGPFSEGGL